MSHPPPEHFSSSRTQSPAPSDASSSRPASYSSAHYLQSSAAQAPAAAASATGSSGMFSGGRLLPNPPTFIEWAGRRFLIMDAPSEGNLELYLRELRRHRVTDLVRVCDPTYPREAVERAGIKVHEMLFPDGEGPSEAIITAWLALVEARFGPPAGETGAAAAEESAGTIAVHCVAGLGRAPVLVAIALIEAGMGYLDAVTFLRQRRRGAINNKQLRFLESYRRRSGSSAPRCLIM